jgi:hypothetical protein
MGGALALEVRAFDIYADAWETQDVLSIAAADTELGGLLRRAGELQARWAAKVERALRRARMNVPPWLHGMAAWGAR